MKKQFHLTEEGIKELRDELNNLIEQRVEMAEKIRIARDFGDLKENAEYASARDDQSRAEGRIAEIENILRNAELIDEDIKHDKVVLGAEVTLKDIKNKTQKFSVVGTVEADPMEGKISDESPIGKALLGRKIGDEVQIVTPAGNTAYTIVTIE